MRFREKIAILGAAVFLAFIGFNTIATPAVDMLKVLKDAGNGIITSRPADTEPFAPIRQRP
jgi:hypothetical protein